MLLDELEDQFEVAQDQFWDGHGFGDLTHRERKTFDCLERLKKTVHTIPGILRYRAGELFAVDAARAHEVLKSMIEQIGPDYLPANAASFVTTMAQRLEARI
jgi:hypothetical protein